MQLIPNADRAHKFWCLWAALAILIINIGAIVVPAFSAKVSPAMLAGFNSLLAVLVMALRVLQQQGIITEKDVPGLGAITGITTTTTTVGAVSMTETKVDIQPEAAAAPSAAPSVTPEKDAS